MQETSKTGSEKKAELKVNSDWPIDSFDILVPNNNELQLLEMAARLGWQRIVFLSKDANYKLPDFKNSKNIPLSKDAERIEIRSAYLLKEVSDLTPAKKRFDYIIGYAERKFFELKKLDFILGAEDSDQKDSVHYRRTSLNQVHAKLAKDSVIIFDFENILNSHPDKRAIILGRFQQNADIIRKYKLKFQAYSMAGKCEDMRSKYVLSAFMRVLKL